MNRSPVCFIVFPQTDEFLEGLIFNFVQETRKSNWWNRLFSCLNVGPMSYWTENSGSKCSKMKIACYCLQNFWKNPKVFNYRLNTSLAKTNWKHLLRLSSGEIGTWKLYTHHKGETKLTWWSNRYKNIVHGCHVFVL